MNLSSGSAINVQQSVLVSSATQRATGLTEQSNRWIDSANEYVWKKIMIYKNRMILLYDSNMIQGFSSSQANLDTTPKLNTESKFNWV